MLYGPYSDHFLASDTLFMQKAVSLIHSADIKWRVSSNIYQILIWSCSCVFLPRRSTAIRTSAFSFVGALNGFLYIPETESTPLQYSCLENPMDGGAWGAAVHGVARSRTRLSDFTFTFHFHALEKEMATHSSVLAWRISGTGKPGGLPSMGSHRVGHD